MTQKNRNLIISLAVAVIIIAAAYYFVQGSPSPKNGNNPTAPVAEKTVEQDLSVSLEVGDVKYQAKTKAGATVYNLMNDLQVSQGLKFSAKEYPGMGALVEEINGVKNDVKANKFWFFYINGQSANEGVSSYVLKNNDVITWKYEVSKF